MKARYNKNLKYNRQTKAYRQTQARAKMKELGIKSPKKHLKHIMIISIILLVLWIPLAFYMAIRMGIPGLLMAFTIVLIYTFLVAIYFRRYQSKLIKTYKDLDIPKDVYMNEMRKRKSNSKDLQKLEKIWDKEEKKREKERGKN